MDDFYQLLLGWVQDPCGQAERVQSRASRKRQRRQRFLDAYWQLAVVCEPILAPYYDHPVYVINRFWATCDFVDMFSNEHYPTAADFFNWFCDSETIEEERAQHWRIFDNTGRP